MITLKTLHMLHIFYLNRTCRYLSFLKIVEHTQNHEYIRMNSEGGCMSAFETAGKVLSFLFPIKSESGDVAELPVSLRTMNERNKKDSEKVIRKVVQDLIDSVQGSRYDLNSDGGKFLVDVIMQIAALPNATHLADKFRQDGLWLTIEQKNEDNLVTKVGFNEGVLELALRSRSPEEIQALIGGEESVEDKLKKYGHYLLSKLFEYQS